MKTNIRMGKIILEIARKTGKSSGKTVKAMHRKPKKTD